MALPSISKSTINRTSNVLNKTGNIQAIILFAILQVVVITVMHHAISRKPSDLLEQNRTWHGGNPMQERPGSCWCNYNNLILSDENRWVNSGKYCMCTPNLAIDIVLVSEDHLSVWLVRRRDTGQYAILGGFVQVGESAEQAVYREVYEEIGYKLTQNIQLLGVYSNPSRDSRRHTVSIVYYATIPESQGQLFRPADDVKEVVQMNIKQISHISLFSDHQTILFDLNALHSGNPRNESPAISINSNQSLCFYSVSQP